MSKLLGHPRLIGLVVMGLVTFVTPRAHGEIVAWLDFDGAIRGAATDRQHLRWIDVHGMTVGAARDIASAGGTREISAPALGEIRLTKRVDVASSRLFLAAVAGNSSYAKVTLDLNSGIDQPLIRLELENVLLGAQSGSASGLAVATESISLNFEKITYIHIQPDATTHFASYDLRTQSAVSGTGHLTDPDHDLDGMPDSWEARYNLSVGTNDGSGDADGDGLSNLHEYQLRTNPQSASSFFKAVLTTSGVSPHNCDITWNSVVGKTYVIEWSPELTTPFVSLRTVVASTASTTETLPRTGPLGFFRVRPL